MSDYKLATRSLFLRLFGKIFLIGVMVLACSPVCYGFQWKGMEIIPSITSTTEYNDNIFYEEEDEVEDVINRVSPGLAIRVPGTRAELELAYEAGFEFFAKNPDWNNIEHMAMGRVRIQPLEHLIFRLNDTFFRGEDTALIDLYGLRRRRERYWANTLTPSFEYTFGPDRVLSLNYENAIIDYESPDVSDSREDIVNPVLTYGIGHSVFTLDYTYTYGDFETDLGELDGHATGLGYEYRLNPLTSIFTTSHVLFRNYTGAGAIDYRAYEIFAGLRRQLFQHLSVSAQGGYLFFDPEEAEGSGSFIGNVTVTYEVLERTLFEFVAYKGYEEIFAAVENLGYANSWGVTGILSHILHRFWRIELTGSYRERDFVFPLRNDRVWTAGGTLVFEPIDWFSAALHYEHTAFDTTASDLEANDYVSNRVMLILQLRY
jgi:hypothetical protein